MTDKATLEEFVFKYQQSKAHKPTEKELSDILDGASLPITILPNGEIAVLGEDLQFAQAVAEFTTRAVLEEIRGELCGSSQTKEEFLNGIDRKLAGMEKK